MAMLFRKYGRKLIKFSKRPHHENLRIAARIPKSYNRLRSQAMLEVRLDAMEGRLLDMYKIEPQFEMIRRNGSQFVNINNNSTGFKDLMRTNTGDYSKITSDNFSHCMGMEANEEDDFSLENLSECESVIIDEEDGFSREDGLMNQDVRQFLRFVVKKVSNNSKMLRSA